MAVDDLASTLADLGVPGLIGAIAGALIAHFSARARGAEDHERELDRLVLQDERATAQGVLTAARTIRNRVNVGKVENYGLLHNEWSDNVLAPSRTIRDPELGNRARSGAYAIFLPTFAPDQHFTYAVVRGCMDVEEWVEAFLARGEPPPAHLPSSEEIGQLIRAEGRIDLNPLNELLEAKERGA
jgi:hypothetical protein